MNINISAGFTGFNVIKITTKAKLIHNNQIKLEVPADTYLVHKYSKCSTIVSLSGDYIELDRYIIDWDSYRLISKEDYEKLKDQPTESELIFNLKRLVMYFEKNRKDSCKTKEVIIGVPTKFKTIIEEMEVTPDMFDGYTIRIYYADDFEIVPFGKI